MKLFLWTILILHVLDVIGRLFRLQTGEYPTLNPKWNDVWAVAMNGTIAAVTAFFIFR